MEQVKYVYEAFKTLVEIQRKILLAAEAAHEAKLAKFATDIALEKGFKVGDRYVSNFGRCIEIRSIYGVVKQDYIVEVHFRLRDNYTLDMNHVLQYGWTKLYPHEQVVKKGLHDFEIYPERTDILLLLSLGLLSV